MEFKYKVKVNWLFIYIGTSEDLVYKNGKKNTLNFNYNFTEFKLALEEYNKQCIESVYITNLTNSFHHKKEIQLIKEIIDNDTVNVDVMYSWSCTNF